MKFMQMKLLEDWKKHLKSYSFLSLLGIFLTVISVSGLSVLGVMSTAMSLKTLAISTGVLGIVGAIGRLIKQTDGDEHT